LLNLFNFQGNWEIGLLGNEVIW